MNKNTDTAIITAKATVKPTKPEVEVLDVDATRAIPTKPTKDMLEPLERAMCKKIREMRDSGHVFTCDVKTTNDDEIEEWETTLTLAHGKCHIKATRTLQAGLKQRKYLVHMKAKGETLDLNDKIARSIIHTLESQPKKAKKPRTSSFMVDPKAVSAFASLI